MTPGPQPAGSPRSSYDAKPPKASMAGGLPRPRHTCGGFKLALALILATLRGLAADNNPPDLMTYQGFLADQNGAPLGNAAPVNYPAIFRIYDQSTAGVLLWSESQIITVDKGLFSVILGQGSAQGSEPRPALSSVFTPSVSSTTISDRYIAINVTISGVATDILPRLRMVPGAFAFTARNANNIIDPSGTAIVSTTVGKVGINKSAPATALDVNGTVTATAFSGSASGLTGLVAAQIPNLDATKISSGVLATAQIPDLNASKLTAGTLAQERLPSNIARTDWTGSWAGYQYFNAGISTPSCLHDQSMGDATLAGNNHINFRCFSGASYNYWENHGDLGTMRWTERGKLGLNKLTPNFVLHIKQLTDSSGFNRNNDGIWLEAAGGGGWTMQTQGGGDLVFDARDGAGNGLAFAYISRSSGTFQVVSDARLKKNVRSMSHILERARKLRPVTFQYNHAKDESQPVVGFVAQEVEPLFPEGVDLKDGHMAIGYAAFGPIAIGAIQELAHQVDELKASQSRIADLEKQAARVDVLEREVSELKKLVADLRR